MVVVAKIPDCDICCEGNGQRRRPAVYDARTVVGPWANLCQIHFDAIGVGLGLGKGQRLILAGTE